MMYIHTAIDHRDPHAEVMAKSLAKLPRRSRNSLAVPLSTMPADVLKVLPKLEEEIEYRFIGRHLILLDPHAHVVVDLVPNAMPA